MNRRSNCYVTCEALYHLLGGKKNGWKPMFMKHEGESHWFLKCNWVTGVMTLDPTVSQFKTEPDYSTAIGKGFLTKKPSKRAKALVKLMVYQEIL